MFYILIAILKLFAHEPTPVRRCTLHEYIIIIIIIGGGAEVNNAYIPPYVQLRGLSRVKEPYTW